MKLKSYQLSQLEYYGFIQVGKEYQKVSKNINQDILKVSDFFTQENIHFDITDLIGKKYSAHEKDSKSFLKNLSIAKNYKYGKVDIKSFRLFSSFLDKLPRTLKDHQKKAAYHHYILKNAANFSTPGSGKTSVVLATYEKLRKEKEINVLFVVGPPSCFGPWINEYRETLGRLPTHTTLSGLSLENRKREYSKPVNRVSDLYLITYHTLTNDLKLIKEFFNRIGLKIILVVDEAHYIKQIGGTWSNSLLEISRLTDFRFILTGTPMPKSYSDVFNLFDFLWPMSPPLNEDERNQIILWEKNSKYEKAEALLETKIGPLFYRVRKKDLGLTTPCFHSPILIKMNPIENKIYSLIKAKVYELSKKDLQGNQELISKLWKGRMIRLRQAVSYPKLLISAIDNYKENLIDNSFQKLIYNYDRKELPAKLDALLQLAVPLLEQNEKLVIWTNFIGTLKLINSHFQKLGFKSELIYGKTPVRKSNHLLPEESVSIEKTREEIISEFLDKSSALNILIANPAACAESISLHKGCKHAVYYDLSYNCAQYLQSLDRIHRIGGSEFQISNYYFLQYENSIDQDIKNNLDKKAKKMYDVIDKDFSIYSLDMFDDLDDIDAYKRLFSKAK